MQDLEKIKNEVLNCKKCPLYKTRKNPVLGSGNLDAKIMFCAEAPGYWEDVKGNPFVGAAGKILNELLESVGLKREEVYICNLLKCRPITPDFKNRAPNLNEIEACIPYLEKQIEIIKPKVICTLGNYSTAFIFEKYGLKNQIQGISKIHGKLFESKTLFGSIKIVPLYHPAVATYNINMKEILKNDFKILEKFKKDEQ
ncbi:MAG: uracil-DNA glycosylase family protein [Candidatus Nealsonbacteria bacterium]